jgi:hypothetical protein
LNHPAVVYRPLRADIEVAMDLYCLFRPGPQPRLLQDFLDVVHRHDVRACLKTRGGRWSR